MRSTSDEGDPDQRFLTPYPLSLRGEGTLRGSGFVSRFAVALTPHP